MRHSRAGTARNRSAARGTLIQPEAAQTALHREMRGIGRNEKERARQDSNL
jgi:hypothetical protein